MTNIRYAVGGGGFLSETFKMTSIQTDWPRPRESSSFEENQGGCVLRELVHFRWTE